MISAIVCAPGSTSLFMLTSLSAFHAVNNACLSIPSYQCQPGDIITIKDASNSKKLVNTFLESPALSNIPQHLDFDKKSLKAKVLGIVDREWVALKLNELFVIEFYSRKI